MHSAVSTKCACFQAIDLVPSTCIVRSGAHHASPPAVAGKGPMRLDNSTTILNSHLLALVKEGQEIFSKPPCGLLQPLLNGFLL
jgi:hypothetical protein